MNTNQPDLTALITTFARAYHSINCVNKIFDDYLAYDILGEESFLFLRDSLSNLYNLLNPNVPIYDKNKKLDWVMKNQSSPITLSRSQYTEDCLNSIIKNESIQYVILGAGLDTYAFRQPAQPNNLQIYELDQPQTQSYKLNRIKELGWSTPNNLCFLPIDFTKENLYTILSGSNFKTDSQSLFSWLGVAMYLSDETILTVLQSIATISAPGSLIIFDYLDLDAFNDSQTTSNVQHLIKLAERSGHSINSGIDSKKLPDTLSQIGLKVKEILTPVDIEKRFFLNCDSGYHSFDHIHFALIEVL
ncbi:class I SAM-dependent methyltransferase [Vallitalea okinawensis]|uniref:class I SAM-dependent methyltransferase n=1 Tax=Vallitalea okinawensis TaxID=2078660 RepID=UPI000CFC9A37|nr:class I SAM-dependent methyltransferase [Vallitalea okinawensis]